MVGFGMSDLTVENACMTDTFKATSLAFVLKETAGEQTLSLLANKPAGRSSEDINSHENCSMYFIASKLSSLDLRCRKAKKYGSSSSSI